METFFEFQVAGHEPARFSDSGDLGVPAGQSIASGLRDQLVTVGLDCTEVVQRDYYGWDWAFVVDGFKVLCTLQMLECFLLVVDVRCGLRGLLHKVRYENAHLQALTRIRAALQGYGGVSSLHEMTGPEYRQRSVA